MQYKELRKMTEKLWARNKYSVMARGYEHYKHVSQALKKADTVEDHYDAYVLIGEAVKLPYTKKGMRTTLEHMWGYFKKQADQDEKRKFFTEMNRLLEGDETLSEEDLKDIRRLLDSLLKKYPSTYICESHFLRPDVDWNVVFEGEEYRGISKEDYKKASENNL